MYQYHATNIILCLSDFIQILTTTSTFSEVCLKRLPQTHHNQHQNCLTESTNFQTLFYWKFLVIFLWKKDVCQEGIKNVLEYQLPCVRCFFTHTTMFLDLAAFSTNIKIRSYEIWIISELIYNKLNHPSLVMPFLCVIERLIHGKYVILWVWWYNQSYLSLFFLILNENNHKQ